VIGAPSDRDRERLEHELESDQYRKLLTKLKRRAPFLRRFGAWRDVIAFMRAGTSRDQRKNEVLWPILAAHSADQDYRWRTILLAIFWPGLVSIHRKKSHWDEDEPDELWQRIFWAFHESICRIDLKRRGDCLVQRIYGATVHRLRSECRRAWKRAEREAGPDNVEIEAVADLNGIDLEDIDRRIAQEIEIERLRGHLDAGRITKADFLLILGTRVYGKPVIDYARELGLDYEVIRKHRQRIEAALRRFETST
jgi:hypothetical protein